MADRRHTRHKDNRAAIFEHKARAAYGEVLQAIELDSHEKKLFDEFYATQVGAAVSKLNNTNPNKVRGLNETVGDAQHKFDVKFEQESPEVQAKVGAAISRFRSEVSPTVFEVATSGLYNRKDENYSVGGGYQVDGAIGAVVGGGIGYKLMDWLGLSTMWKVIAGAVGAIVGSLLMNRATDAAHGTERPALPEIPEGTHAPKPKELHAKEHRRPMGNAYAMPGVHSPSFADNGQIHTGVPNQDVYNFPGMNSRDWKSYTRGAIGSVTLPPRGPVRDAKYDWLRFRKPPNIRDDNALPGVYAPFYSPLGPVNPNTPGPIGPANIRVYGNPPNPIPLFFETSMKDLPDGSFPDAPLQTPKIPANTVAKNDKNGPDMA